MEDEGPSPWSDEVLLPRFDAAVEQYLPMLAGCVEPSEVDELREACRVSFELMFYTFHGDDPEDYFVKGLPEVVRVAVADGGGAVREFLEVWRFRKGLSSTGSWICEVARQLRRKEVELTPELRQAVKEKDRGYMGCEKGGK